MRNSYIIGLLLTVLISQNTLADEPTTQSGIATSSLNHAIKDAEALGNQRWAFSTLYTSIEDDGNKSTYRLNFDPRRDEGKRWTLIEPTEETLSKEEKKAFRKISSADNADESLVYDSLSDRVTPDDLISESDGFAVFKGQFDDDDMPKSVRDALKMEIILDTTQHFVTKISVIAEKPFKPAPVAKVNTMQQIQTYAPVGPKGEILLTRSTSVVEGKAFFKAFSSNTITEYSDFTRVDGPAFPEDE